MLWTFWLILAVPLIYCKGRGGGGGGDKSKVYLTVRITDGIKLIADFMSGFMSPASL